MARIIFLLICFTLLINCNEKKQAEDSQFTNNKPQNLRSFIDFKYDQVIAFATVNPMEQPNINDFNLDKFKDTISRRLDSNQIHTLNDILSGKEKNSEDNLGVADCFYPRHNIVFLNKNKVVNYILICFECNDVKSSKPTFASMKNYEDFFNSLGLKAFHDPFEHATYYDSIKPIKNRFQ